MKKLNFKNVTKSDNVQFAAGGVTGFVVGEGVAAIPAVAENEDVSNWGRAVGGLVIAGVSRKPFPRGFGIGMTVSGAKDIAVDIIADVKATFAGTGSSDRTNGKESRAHHHRHRGGDYAKQRGRTVYAQG